ncbi:MAG: D-ribose pyranase [Spirochaetes bacterium]|nr:MAG: D-ribose pyranase [Spirochaetota bacterium]RKX88189.1 MAG: D-ribose pyranase [Spirochaetota bacterium]RKX97025.1 MAG: D-ribose pyranase [Spirochaetota bacterium]
MKKTVLLNAPVSRLIASMGHTDSLCIADAGLPVPEESERIDLAVTRGIPSFPDVLSAVLDELEVERALCAEEIKEKNPQILAEIKKSLGDIPLEFTSHDIFKSLTKKTRGVVRSGECTPFANIILYSGVPF